jgi:hypothetical protein
MNALNRSSSLAAFVAAALASTAQAAEPKLPRDGWVSWDVPVGDAPAWCCFNNRGAREGAAASCKLDGHDYGIGTRHDERTDTVTVYARSAAGKLDRLRVLSATCPVETKTPVEEQAVTADESTRWLISQVKNDSSNSGHSLADDALAALSMHSGDLARDGMISLGNTDARSQVRSQAWFWLAMSGRPGVESPISTALRKDSDDYVREQAVFALSRLPEDRATKALAAVAEDRSLSREQRKRAVFWLAQSDSDAAQAYLEKVLAVSSVPQK